MKVTIFNSFCEDFDSWKKEAEENNECELTDGQAWSMWADCVQDDWDFFLDTLHEVAKRSKCSRFIADGICGLWYGQRSGGATRDSLRDLVNALCEGADDWKITIEDGEMFVYHYHHDGTNWFKVRGITDRGIEFEERTRWDFGEGEVADRIISKDTLSVSLGKFFQWVAY